ncbi:MAG: DUF2232 domain-containing protein [Elainella sp.]
MSSPEEFSPSESNQSESNQPESRRQAEGLERLEQELAEVEASLDYKPTETPVASGAGATAYVKTVTPPLVMVETAFLASTASLLWLVSYYLSIGPWMRILFPTPIALVYLRWGHRAAWMAAITCGLLLSVLMGPYLSLLFFVPYALMGVQLGAMWKRRSPWFASIGLGTLISTFGFFMRVGLLSIFLGEDLWSYLTNRITDLIQLVMGRLVNWGLLGLDALTPPSLPAVQLATLGVVLCSDLVYLFTVHLAAWLLLERLGNPIPNPPRWVQVILDEER